MRRSVTRKGVVLSYRVSGCGRGRGPVVVLVQGLAFPGEMWLSLPATLAEAGYTVVTPDNRGSGRSSKPWRPYRLRTMAEDLAAIIDEISPGAPVVVVGISLGGMIAQELAIRYPEHVKGLVLAATSCGLLSGAWPRLGDALTMVRASLGARGMDEALHRVLVHPDSRQQRPGLFDEWDRVLAACGRSALGTTGQLLAILTHHSRGALKHIRCPTVVLAGDSDWLIPPGNAAILADRIPNAELQILPRAGHAFPLEVPDALPKAIQRVACGGGAGSS